MEKKKTSEIFLLTFQGRELKQGSVEPPSLQKQIF